MFSFSRDTQRLAILAVCCLIILGGSLTSDEAKAARKHSSQRECATCHIMWLKDFKRQDVSPLIDYDPTPLESTGRQDVASTERMCFSCHDGFVLDSRSSWRNKEHHHPVGIKPSHKVKIPTSKGKTIFPLNEDGKLYCGSCHTAHGVSWEQKESPLFMRVKNVESSMCLACHLDKATDPREGNHPLFEKPPYKAAKRLARAGAKFAADGSVICQSCHSSHGASARKMLVVDNKNAELCESCHRNKRQVRRSKHDMSIMAPKEKNGNGDTADKSGPCGACHVPHNGKGPAMWARQRTKNAEPQSASCLGCHNKDGPAPKKTVGKHSHPLGTDVHQLGIKVVGGKWSSESPLMKKGEKLVALPLYDKQGLRSAKGSLVGCGSCHDPHVWQAGSTPGKTSDPRKLEGDASNSFLRIAGDEKNTLCVNCHVSKRSVFYSKHNSRLAGKTAPKVDSGKSTIKKDVCSTCHVPHGAKDHNLWARNKAKAETAIAGMCGDCHNNKGIAKDRLIGKHNHPLGKPVPDDGKHTELPLFTRDGKRNRKEGGVDCASCHNAHQWDPENPASTAGTKIDAEGDTQTSFLRLPVAKNSKLCISCHKKQRWVHNTEHDLKVSAPRATNSLKQNVRESGPCGQCHVPHHATTDAKIWARPLGDGKDETEKLCRSCHQDKQIAELKQPPASRHPDTVEVWSEKLRKRFRKTGAQALPVYDQHGKPGATGRITCVTCHNPHQWTADQQKSGPGKNTEGNIESSFLRIKDSRNFVCADCHGMDALFRYKYYHGKSSRKRHRLFR